MPVILALDSAWTAAEPSGVALVASTSSTWRCVAVAPSYDAFLALAAGRPVQWNARRFSGAVPNVSGLLSAARSLASADVDLVALDIPVATVPITSRRAADDAISSAYGGRGCSTHSPSRSRPGRLGANLIRDLAAAGYRLATTSSQPGLIPRSLEVYPHPALLTLLGRNYRVPYKVAKSKRHWPLLSPKQRVQRLLAEFAGIDQALRGVLGPTGIPLPAATQAMTLASLKRYEDALDALVCAWVGSRYLSSAITAHGDSTAAIWTP